MTELNINQGLFANQSGNTLEFIITSTLINKEFKVVPYRDFIKMPAKYGAEVLLKGVPYTTIYNHPGKTEFLLKSAKYNLEVRIECKWQQVAGSVDEKFAYLYLNCIEQMPEQHILIIVDGNGAKKGSVQWLKNACEHKLYTSEANKNKLINVMTIADFLTWTNVIFR